MEKYTSEQFWKLYKELPQELKSVLFGEETGNNIYETCKRNKVQNNLEEVVQYVGQVLIGVLPPDELQDVLEKEVKLEKDVAKKVAQEIHRFIFYPVKTSLEELYKIEITPLIKPIKAAPPSKEEPLPTKTTTKKEPTPSKPVSEEKDTYREPLEEE